MKIKMSLLLLFSILMISCSKETITPIVKPRRLKSEYRLIVPIGEDEVQILGKDVEDSRMIIGDVLVDVLGLTADLLVEGGVEVDSSPSIINAKGLNEVDFSLIKSIKVNHLFLQMAEEKSSSRGIGVRGDVDQKVVSLHLIKELELFLLPVGETGDSAKLTKNELEDSGIKVLSFKRERDKYSCLTKCLKLKPIGDIDWKEVLKNNRRFIIKKNIIVDSVNKEKLAYKGHLDVTFSLNLPF